MSIEDKIDALIVALNANTRAVEARAGITHTAADAPPKRARAAVAEEPKPTATTGLIAKAADSFVTKQQCIDAMRDYPREVVAGLLKPFAADGKMSSVSVSDYPKLLAAAQQAGAQQEAADPLLD